MVTINDVENGLAAYFSNELIPNCMSLVDDKYMQKLIKAGLATISAMYIKKIEHLYVEYKDNPLVQMSGVIDGDGNMDLEAFLEEFKVHIDDLIFEKETKIGSIKFYKEDLDQVYKYIKQASENRPKEE